MGILYGNVKLLRETIYIKNKFNMEKERKKFLDGIVERDFKKPFMLTSHFYGIDKVEEVVYMFDKVYGRGKYYFSHGEDFYHSPKRVTRIGINSVEHKDSGYFETLYGNGRGESYLTDGRIVGYILHNHKLK